MTIGILLSSYKADRADLRPLPSWWIAAAILIGLVYVFLVGHRPVFYVPGADYDDELFASMAMRLASGHWLGPYTATTLIKGIGFPLFLAIDYLIGIPTNMGLCLAYAAASAYFSMALRPLIRSNAAVLALFALLLFIPPLSSSATMRLNREFFYTSEVLALFGSVINLFWRARPRSHLGAGLLAGGLGAWVCLTREETVWLAPPLLILAASGWVTQPRQGRSGPKALLIGLLAAALLVASVGLVNRMAYGRFVINETTGSALQGALSELEKAAYPDWKAYVPVPLGARLRLYEQSPSFRRLKPYLDPAGEPSVWTNLGCDETPTTCGDIGGGWFIWALRDAAAQAGEANNPKQAAAFFRTVAAEVSAACDDGRLTCARWLAPMVPPFTRGQLAKFPRQIRTSARFAAMIESVNDGWPSIAALGGMDLQQLELTSVPEHGPGSIVELHGVLSGPATTSLAAIAIDPAQMIEFHRTPDPTAASSAGEAAAHGGFDMTVGCLIEPCGVKLGDASGNAIAIPDLTGTTALGGSRSLGQSRVTINSIVRSPTSLRTRAGTFWVRHLPALQTLYQILIAAGAPCYGLGLAFMVLGRKILPLTLIATALVAGVASRLFLLALVDATSFSALDYGYMAPALPMTLSACVLSLIQAASIIRQLRFKESP